MINSSTATVETTTLTRAGAKRLTSAYRMRGLRISYHRGDAAWVRKVLRAACIWGTVPYVGNRGLLTDEQLATIRRREPLEAEVPFDRDRPTLAQVLAVRGAEVVS